MVLERETEGGTDRGGNRQRGEQTVEYIFTINMLAGRLTDLINISLLSHRPGPEMPMTLPSKDPLLFESQLFQILSKHFHSDHT
jgi:hypothetical protein